MKCFSFSLIVIFSLLMTACSGLTSSPSAGELPDASQNIAVPSPVPGKAVVSARLTNKTDNSPIADQLVRLAKIYGEGTESVYVYNESTDPGAYTSAEGYVVITEVEPGPYAFILIDENGNYAPINENSEKVLTVDVEAGKSIDVGSVAVELPAPTKQP